MSTPRSRWLVAVADPQRVSGGVAVVASMQHAPATDRPFLLRGRHDTPRSTTHVTLALTPAEARKACLDFVAMGLFGRHGRIATDATGDTTGHSMRVPS